MNDRKEKRSSPTFSERGTTKEAEGKEKKEEGEHYKK